MIQCADQSTVRKAKLRQLDIPDDGIQMLSGSLARVEVQEQAEDPFEIRPFRNGHEEVVSTAAQENTDGPFFTRDPTEHGEIRTAGHIFDRVTALLESLDSPLAFCLEPVDNVWMGRVIEPRVPFREQPGEAISLRTRIAPVTLDWIPRLSCHRSP